MRIANLDLHQFRNYHRLHLDLAPGVNIFFGRNAAGKTNILEAVFFLATSRSHRTHQDQELVTWGEEALAVRATLDSGYGQIQAELRYERDRRKQIRLGGSAVRVVDLLGRAPVVIFAPDDLQMLKGSPSLRRRYLDLFLSQTHPQYFKALQSYVRVVSQRNGLLRQLREGGGSASTLEVWDEQFLDFASTVAAYRLGALKTVERRAAEAQAQLSDGRETLKLDYIFSAGDLPADREQAREQLSLALRERRREELARAQTLVGPHRDDLRVQINGVEARSYGSQGQQRSAVLALKLAELDYLRSELQTDPVLLLDDVTSELDGGRRKLLLETVDREPQTFITCTALSDLDPRWLERSRLYQVESGEVREYGGD